MCGRFGLFHTWADMYEAYALTSAPRNLEPRFNIAPGQDIVTIVAPRAGAGREATLLRWGLVPGWAEDAAIGARMINARAETVAEKPAFRAAFRRRRCLVPASGFYEWQARAGAAKQPFWIAAADGGLLTFAGLWEVWTAPDGSALRTCAIVTTAANDLLRPIHPRMPALVAPADFATWLDGDADDPAAARALLRPAPPETLVARAVSTRVNRVANDDARLIEPVAGDRPADRSGEADEDPSSGGGQGNLFAS